VADGAINRKVRISAAILCANWMDLESDLRFLEQEGIDYIHYDIMDGFFVPDYCLGTSIINVIRRNTKIPADYHLMVEEPSRILGNFSAEDDSILSVHYEACRNLHRDLVGVKNRGFKVGLVLNPGTPLGAIEYVIEEVAFVNVMTSNPGYAEQNLVPQALKKVELLCGLREKNKLNYQIVVEGNVSDKHIPEMVSAGCDVLVGDSAGLFVERMHLKESISGMKRAIDCGLALRLARSQRP
jgi:ribulose-phosphate 3-epimerase